MQGKIGEYDPFPLAIDLRARVDHIRTFYCNPYSFHPSSYIFQVSY